MASLRRSPILNLGKESIRCLTTAATTRPIHRLTLDSPYIRSFGNPDISSLTKTGDDFLYFPDFFNEAEQEILLKLALWKLDRVDASRRRRRRKSAKSAEGQMVTTGLQRLFEDTSAYGFEDVSFLTILARP
jgi:alkylated DNA repair protein alkB family protein 7